METLSDKKEYENALEYIKMKEFIRNSTDEKNVDSLIKKYEILQQENTQLKAEKEEAIKSISHYVYERDILKQQLKDKDELLSKNDIENIISCIEIAFGEMCSGEEQEDCFKLGKKIKEVFKEILESNKED